MANKTAVVTGGAGLIGKQIVLAFAEAGAKTVIGEINEKKGKMGPFAGEADF